MPALHSLRSKRIRTRRLLSWAVTVLFGLLLGCLCVQVVQRVHDRYTPHHADRFSEFLNLEFYTGGKGQRRVPGTDTQGARPERLALSVYLYPNAYLDLSFHQDPDASCLLRISASPEMPSAFVRRREESAVQVVPLVHPWPMPFRWHRLELDMDGPRFTALMDGVAAGTWEDGSCLASGVGLASGFGLVKVDRLEVTGTELRPRGGRRPFVFRWENVYRRPWAVVAVLAGCVLLVCTERAVSRGVVRRLRRSRWSPAGTYGFPLLCAVAGLLTSVFPKMLFLALTVLSLVLSRVWGVFCAAADFWPKAVSFRGRSLAVVAAFLLFLAAIVLLLSPRQRIPPDRFVDGPAFREPAVRKLEPNFPLMPRTGVVRDFRWEFEARMEPGTVAEVVFRRDGKEPAAQGCPEHAPRNWYALVLSNVPGLAPGFAKIRGLQDYRKKAPEVCGEPLPEGRWFPVRLQARGNVFEAEAAGGLVVDRLRDSDFEAGTCGVVLLSGAMEVRNSALVSMEVRQGGDLREGEGRVFPSPPGVARRRLRSPAPVPNFGWYLKTHYRYENSFLADQSFRCRRFSREKPWGTTRLVCMGGSSTYGLFLPPERGADYPHELERLLNDRGGQRRFEVFNAGVIGTYSLRSVEYLSQVLLPFRPDGVLVNLVWNDNIIPAVMEKGYPQFKETLHGWRRWGIVAPLLYARAWFDFLAGGWEFARRMKTGEDGGYAINPENLPLYERNLCDLVDTAERGGARIAFILEPSSDVLVVPRDRELLFPFYEAVRKVGGSRQVPVIDPRPDLRDHKYDDLFYDVMHLTPTGHRLMAAAISRRLREEWPDMLAGPGKTAEGP